jgi:phosphohistidine phosphatase SixA
MRVTIVRHARAVSKREWSGTDRLRPLDDVGEKHAVALVDALPVAAIRCLMSSPALRCVQTLEPLARHTGLPIEISELLAADGDARTVLARLDHDVLSDAVLCTHGEVMRPLLRQMRRRHVDIVGDPGRRGSLLRKGVAWQLDIGDNGVVGTLNAIPPIA